MSIDPVHPCAHPPCICEVREAGAFCSDHCREAATLDSETCTCGHLDCALEPEAVAVVMAPA